MSPEKEMEMLIDIMKDFVSEDIRGYVIESNYGSGWGLLHYLPDNILLSISYSGIYGVSISSVLKPDRIHGTGYALFPEDPLYPQSSKKACIPELCKHSMILLSRDIKKPEFPWVQEKTMRDHMYKDPAEYFEKSCANTKYYQLT